MIAKKHRFRGHRRIKNVLRKGVVVRHDFFKIKYLANLETDSYRLAVVVSKKISKKAVVRNRIRRQLYEIFRRQLKDSDLRLDLVVIVLKTDLTQMAPDDLKQIFLKKINWLTKSN